MSSSNSPSYCGAARVSLAGATDRGLRPQKNEDSLTLDPAFGLAVVADGVGGERAGEVASAIATRVVQEAVRKRLLATAGDYVNSIRLRPEELALIVRAALVDAHSELLAQGATAATQGMASTVTAVFVHDDLGVIGWAGDSPAFLLRDGRLTQLTRSHNVQENVSGGRNHVEKPRSKGALTMVAGGGGDPFFPDIHCETLSAGDILLACSDGLTDMLDDARILAIVDKRRYSLDRAALALVAAANEAGGDDNITVALVGIESVPSPIVSRAAATQWGIRPHLPLLGVAMSALAAGLVLGGGLAFALLRDPVPHPQQRPGPYPDQGNAPRPQDMDLSKTHVQPAAPAPTKAYVGENAASSAPAAALAPSANEAAVGPPPAEKSAKPHTPKRPAATRSSPMPTVSTSWD